MRFGSFGIKFGNEFVEDVFAGLIAVNFDE